METIRLRSRSGEDGILHLDLPVTMKEVEWDVTVTLQPVALPSQGKGYPAGFFEQTYGSCQDDPIVIDDEGIYEEQDNVL
ncbi:MAG: hypothetical protein N4J56_007873 [Chroococcidiopsis sp. SAG 2025]|uniref:hypothetical protein n=1 Tax=Chroococcidiopsis sp. SAG 2025 TaxID=171389 RepID=UPI0029371CF8|nr:hypothetical protein [Chroococcidiopsis sp. SAG 2025]MDV2998168.1 hypothetical protein [Chroococcidiopsis sp. SAG 2025]